MEDAFLDKLMALRPVLAAQAQTIVRRWTYDRFGACSRIATSIADILSHTLEDVRLRVFDVNDPVNAGVGHAMVEVWDAAYGFYVIDIPWAVYETWEYAKIESVEPVVWWHVNTQANITENDVLIRRKTFAELLNDVLDDDVHSEDLVRVYRQGRMVMVDGPNA